MKNMSKLNVVNMFQSQEHNQGIRIIPFQTETDSMGTDENVETMSAAQLIRSAWSEIPKFLSLVKVGQAMRSAEQNEFYEKFEEAMQKALDESEDEWVDLSKAPRVVEFWNLNKGCLIDHKADIGEPLHPNWVTWAQGDAPEVEDDDEAPNDPFDRREEVMPEFVFHPKTKQEKQNFLQIEAWKSKRQQHFEKMQVKMIGLYQEAMSGSSKMRHKAITELATYDRKINEARDFSFAQKFLDGMFPAMKDQSGSRKRDFYLSRDQKMEVNDLTGMRRQVYFLYQQSRALTFKQQQSLLNMRLRVIEAARKREVIDVVEELTKIEAERELLKFDLKEFDRQFLLVIRDNLREKWSYFKEMVEDLHDVRSKVTGLSFDEKEELLCWALERMHYVEEMAQEFVQKHNISKDEQLDDYLKPTAE